MIPGYITFTGQAALTVPSLSIIKIVVNPLLIAVNLLFL